MFADSDESLEKLLWKEMEKRGIRNIGKELKNFHLS